MKDQELVVLIRQYLKNSITDEDLVLLRNELTQKSEDDLLEIWDKFSELPIDFSRSIPNADDTFEKIIADHRVQATISQNNSYKLWRRVTKRSVQIIAAAAVILVLKLGIDYLRQPQSLKNAATSNQSKELILPGGNRAKIVLTDGTEIDLEKLKPDTLIRLAGYSIQKNKDGSVEYFIDENAPADLAVYNTIVTPKGGEYQLSLSDGTQVFINASSRLRYPVQFDSGEREVELEGEAYFEVAKKLVEGTNVPFIVKTKQQILEVLGTTFNINSYGKSIQTTLIEGSVKLSYKNGESHIIKPNQQLTFTPQGSSITIAEVDPFYVLAWKNGAFSFEDASIYQVMESIARWYDVEIEYKNDFSGNRFSGSMSRSDDIEKVLKTIELTGQIKFIRTGRRVVVRK
ncbi:DUF4974 domain-containing protein [Sphingobacterium shayense]|uniref:FecR family protein n=1 Tax=Sphingobacterium shayense TaxID=626343 RepID=UPI0015564C3A|nr:FecR domain-containing protein [Sphingobacterium shayense]NQD72190.1 DUF4974 domain-containing protein [Sphingobacterium shayense]